MMMLGIVVEVDGDDDKDDGGDDSDFDFVQQTFSNIPKSALCEFLWI